MTDSSGSDKQPHKRSKPSHTAAKVARGVAFLAREPDYACLLPVGCADSIEKFALASGAMKPWMLRMFDNDFYRRSVLGNTNRFWPGEMMRIVLRKRFVDDEVRAAINEGASQLLIVGAGFDTVGIRVANDYPNVQVVELDMPATAISRQETIEQLGWRRGNHIVVGADLGVTSLQESLEGVSVWSRDARSVVLAEGVLMYLTRKEADRFLAGVKSNTGDTSRLVFTYLTADPSGKPYMGKASGFSRVSLALLGETLRWGLREGELEEFLESGGYELLGPAERYHLGERYLEPLGRPTRVGTVEKFAVAETVAT